MHIEGPIPFKSSTNQTISSLYFLRISISFCSFSFVKSTYMITSFDFSTLKKAYFRCLGNSFKINPSELIYTSCILSSLLLDFSTLCSFRLSTVSFNSKLEFINSTSISSIYWKFISFLFMEIHILVQN